MKKLYTLLFVAAMTLTVKAQTTETFDAFDTTAAGSNYADGTFVGVGGITWTYAAARSTSAITEDGGPYAITGNGFVLRRPSTSYLEATFPNGLSSFSFQYRKAFTGGSVRQLEVLVNGVSAGTTAEFGSGTGEITTVFSYSAPINQTGAVTVRIKNVGDIDQNRQSTIDNIVWAPAGTNGTKQNQIAGLKLSPNPLTGNVLNVTSNSNAAKNVAIFDITGKQVVNTTTVNSTINTGNLTSGVYIVKVTEEGKTATKKLVVQ